MSRKAARVVSPPGTSEARERQESTSSVPPGVTEASRTIPSSENPSPSEVRSRYFQPPERAACR
jgi:hypothetical protein